MYHILHVLLNDKFQCRLAYKSEYAALFNRDVLVRTGYLVIREVSKDIPERTLKERDIVTKLSNLLQKKFNEHTYNHKGVIQ